MKMKTRKNLNNFLVMLVFLLATLCTAAAGGTIYVDAYATGANDGTTWANAYNYLQDALAVATSGDEIKVAGGVYKPDEGTGVTAGDPYATFQLISGVAIYGGFGGESTLSGDIGTPGNNSDNSYHVVTASGCGVGTILNGFIITRGDTSPLFNRHGGGMHIVDSSLTVRSCTFSENTASLGGGMYNKDSSPDITDCTFISNRASRNGGGMHNNNSAPKVTNCTFRNNQAEHNGGGINTVEDSAADITNCTFIDNSAGGGGGGLHVTSSSPTLVNCTFSDNSAEYGGGMHSGGAGTPTAINCVFVANSAGDHAGAMNNSSDTTVTNCTLYGNSAPRVGGMLNINSRPIVTNCIIWGNTDELHNSGEGGQIDGNLGWMTINYSCIQGWTGFLGGLGNIGDDPLFVNAGGGNCRLLAGSPCIDAGDNSAPGLSGPDIDGNSRIIGLAVDMGAYEFQELLEHAAVKTERLVDEVETLDLPKGTENSLVSKLENAIDSIQKGQANAAVNKLEAYINQVEAQRGKKITNEQADELIAAAQQIIDLLMAD